MEEPDPADTLDSKALIQAASDQIRAIDFHVRQFPFDTSLHAPEPESYENFFKDILIDI